MVADVRRREPTLGEVVAAGVHVVGLLGAAACASFATVMCWLLIEVVWIEPRLPLEPPLPWIWLPVLAAGIGLSWAGVWGWFRRRWTLAACGMYIATPLCLAAVSGTLIPFGLAIVATVLAVRSRRRRKEGTLGPVMHPDARAALGLGVGILLSAAGALSVFPLGALALVAMIPGAAAIAWGLAAHMRRSRAIGWALAFGYLLPVLALGRFVA